MVEGVDQRKRRGTVKGAAVVQRSRDVDRRLVHIGNAEVDLPHDGRKLQIAVSVALVGL